MEGIIDLITGRQLPDSEDEPVRQAAEARLLELGYRPEQVAVDHCRQVETDQGPLPVRADLLVSLEGRPALLIRCARGSLVSREREAVAAARLVADPWPPLSAVYNGESGELLDTAEGKVLAEGGNALPGPEALAELMARRAPRGASERETLQAARIYRAYGFISCPGQCSV
ncbi:MAG: type I restriction enzyme HsdR N-terminal domain-containing protein [Desulfarculus sp.]|nr:type I restriction enzyme HsdR N-terminal domain-containing protein [Desulfarculus sp.]